jgi:hypothetical protein
LRRILPNHCSSLAAHYPGQRHLYIGRLLISNWLIMHKIITWLFKSWLISRFKILHKLFWIVHMYFVIVFFVELFKGVLGRRRENRVLSVETHA